MDNHVAAFAHDFMKIFILLFADDIVLMSETVIGLKKSMEYLTKYYQLLD